MTINMVRDDYNDTRTFGHMFFDDGFQCFTLEDPVRPDGVKIMHDTAIAADRYRVVITKSRRFKVMLPLLLEVPMFEGIRIHAGNSKLNTSGCILVGLARTTDTLLNSRDALTQVQKRIAYSLAHSESVWLDIQTATVETLETFETGEDV